MDVVSAIRITLSATSSASRSYTSLGEPMVALRWTSGGVIGIRAKSNRPPGAAFGAAGRNQSGFAGGAFNGPVTRASWREKAPQMDAAFGRT